MGNNAKSNKNSKAKTSAKKGSNKKNVYNGKDPLKVRVTFAIFMLFMILTFAVGAFSILVMSDANANDGILYFMGKSYSPIADVNGNDGPNGGVFVKADSYSDGTVIGYKFVNKSGRVVVGEGTFKGMSDDGMALIEKNSIEGPITGPYNASAILGQKVDSIPPGFFMNIASSPSFFLIIFAAFIACTFVLGLVYYLISPRGAKQFDKKEEVTKTVVTKVNSENSELLSHYLSTDDNIQPIDPEQNETGAILNINYYNSVRLNKGEVYTVVKKYQENARRLEEYGASDMDIIRMNMIGNAEFDDLILNTHKEKTMTMWEIIDYARSLDGVYCIKKRGTLNWTYKYKSKTLFIIKRENDESESYKVSIKVYPDAATKLNIIYKALEDSSFPNGPYWYMFNDLRNLPANVIKWLIKESLNISKWQQTKADLLRDTPNLASFKLDADYMRDMILAGTKYLDMGKFDLINQTDTEDGVKYNTCLETGFMNIDMEQFTKEISMNVPGLKNTQMSILTRKNASEALVNALCNELLDFAPSKSDKPNPEEVNNLNNIIASSATKVVKKSKKK